MNDLKRINIVPYIALLFNILIILCYVMDNINLVHCPLMDYCCI